MQASLPFLQILLFLTCLLIPTGESQLPGHLLVQQRWVLPHSLPVGERMHLLPKLLPQEKLRGQNRSGAVNGKPFNLSQLMQMEVYG